MSFTSPESSHSPRHQYEQLSQQASTLTTTLARRRADVALLRAEAATMAVSLESAKEQLENLLRHEVVIRNRAIAQGTSPRAGGTGQGERWMVDAGLVQSLKGQLEVTLASVRAAEEKKKSLLEEIEMLEEGDEEREEVSGVQLVEAREGKCDGDGESAAGAGGIEGFTVSGEEGMSGPLEAAAIRALKDGVESKSAFRLDHAKIWRDVTMPNLALIPKGQDASLQPEVTLGVAVERIFEGVTCFQPTQSQPDASHPPPRDLQIHPTQSIHTPPQNIIQLLSNFFSVLTVSPREQTESLRVLAPTVALQRIMDLITRQDKDKVKRARPPLVDNPAKLDPIIEQSPNKQTTASPKHTTSPRRKRSHDIQRSLSVKLIDPSHVLHKEHFAQIMAQGVPIRFRESALQLIYSTNLHGMSLNTLFNRVKTTSPTLVCIRDTSDRMFGCYAASPWKSSATRYYGTGESFVFGTDGTHSAKVYKWSRANSFFQFTSSTFLAIGGGTGSHFALWVDEDLLMGTTSACATFASPPLTNTADQDAPNTTEFKIVALEVWAFNAHGKH